jgi:hypothetical protein
VTRGLVAALLTTLSLLIATSVQASHVRPKGATPFRMPLVPAYSQCTSPNETHGPPLAFPSCSAPAQTSAQATVGTPDAYGGTPNFSGYFRLAQFGGVPGPPDDQEVSVELSVTDVRCAPGSPRCGSPNASGPADYAGEVRIVWTIRQSDHFNAVAPGGGADPATVQDYPFEVTVLCNETSSTSAGSACSVATLMNAIVPGVTKEKRDVHGIMDIRIDDGGADGDGDTTADNTVFLRPGVFIP